MTDIKQLNISLLEKMRMENTAFTEVVKTLPPQEIIDLAYRIVMQDDIISSIAQNHLSPQRAKVLLKLEKPMDSLYQNWLDCDCSHMELLWDTITDCGDFHRRLAIDERRKTMGGKENMR